MKKINYSMIGLVILGFVFVAGNSFAQSRSGPATPPHPLDVILRPAQASYGQYSGPSTSTAGTKR